MTEPWEAALDEVARRTVGLGEPWMLVGSASLAAQGVALRPNDIDLMARRPEGVRALARAFADLAPPAAEGTSPATWRSTAGEPVLEFGDHEQWTLGRWFVDGFKIEAAHIAFPGREAAMSDVTGEPVWAHARSIKRAGFFILVAPLEVQLATTLLRDQPERAEAIAAVLREESLDDALFERAARDNSLEPAALKGLSLGGA